MRYFFFSFVAQTDHRVTSFKGVTFECEDFPTLEDLTSNAMNHVGEHCNIVILSINEFKNEEDFKKFKG
jgi:hypothetical protein